MKSPTESFSEIDNLINKKKDKTLENFYNKDVPNAILVVFSGIVINVISNVDLDFEELSDFKEFIYSVMISLGYLSFSSVLTIVKLVKLEIEKTIKKKTYKQG